MADFRLLNTNFFTWNVGFEPAYFVSCQSFRRFMEKRPYPGSKFSTFIPFIAKNLAPSFWPKYNSHPCPRLLCHNSPPRTCSWWWRCCSWWRGPWPTGRPSSQQAWQHSTLLLTTVTAPVTPLPCCINIVHKQLMTWLGPRSAADATHWFWDYDNWIFLIFDIDSIHTYSHMIHI